MSVSHLTDTLRIELVGARADLRHARQELLRTKRAVTHLAPERGKTAKEREFLLDLFIHEHGAVQALENQVLALQKAEDLAAAQLENALRPVADHQWFVRQSQADAIASLAAIVSESSVVNFVLSLVTATGDDGDGAYQGQSAYLKERAVRA